MTNEKKIDIINQQIDKLNKVDFNFRTWLAESKNLLDLVFDNSENKKHQLVMATRNPAYMFSGVDVMKLKEEWRQLMEGFRYEIKILSDEITPFEIDKDEFVYSERIQELEQIKSSDFDLSKLIKLCYELNSNYSNRNYLSVAMVGRSILDHIPPILGFNSFNEVANNYGSQSFKKNMEHLNKSMRSIADLYLHQKIRRKENLPNKIQVDFRRELDLLLSEIIRKINE